MEGFERGFYSISKKLKRKLETNIGQLSFSQSQNLEFKRDMKSRRNPRKRLMQQGLHLRKPRKRIKSAHHQEVSDFNPSSQINMEQLIKVVLNLKEEVLKLRKDNENLMEQLSLAEEQNPDLCPKKENQAFSEIYHKTRIANLQIASEIIRSE